MIGRRSHRTPLMSKRRRGLATLYTLELAAYICEQVAIG